MTAPIGRADQPISSVTWLDRGLLHANDWNPNHVAPPEFDLLRQSLLEDGWTTAIVVGPHATEAGHYEIVDGFHRWTISAEPDIWKLTDGLVPVVIVDRDEAERRLATVRHNRARGTHHVVKMADIVVTLVADLGLTEEDVMRRLGMDREEVRRLLQRGDMLQRGASPTGFTEAWRPAPKQPAAGPT